MSKDQQSENARELDADAIIAEVREVMTRDGISQYKVAKESGIKEATLSPVMTGV